MKTQNDQPVTPQPNENSEAQPIDALYKALLDAWNRRDAAGYAALFTENGSTVGFDGSQMDGQTIIRDALQQIFDNHMTAVYIGKVREVRFLSADVAMLRAVSGMVPRGQRELNPAVNTIQGMVAVRQNGSWRIALYQNTPAQFHGRPDLADALTNELRQLL